MKKVLIFTDDNKWMKHIVSCVNASRINIWWKDIDKTLLEKDKVIRKIRSLRKENTNEHNIKVGCVL